MIKKIAVVSVVLLAIITRFYKLDWGDGFFFHPDENNMAWAVLRMRENKLDPGFYAYGQFPLFLTFFSLGKQTASFAQAVWWLRFWSAFFSLITLLVGYFLAKQLFGQQNLAVFYLLLLIFTPGLIQVAHFGTTESILTASLLTLSWLACCLVKKGAEPKLLLFTALMMGIALASKISALVFLAPLGLAFSWRFFQEKRKKQFLLSTLSFLALTIFFFALFCPFYFLKWPEVWRVIQYEAGVARGKIPVFYTRQFIHTQPILFQLKKIFPWTLGTPLFLLLLISLGYFLVRLGQKKIKLSVEFYLLFSAFAAWFFPNAFLFAKWTRFMVPVLPFLVLAGVWLLKEIGKTWWWFIFPLLIAPGVIFGRLYLQPDIRVQATAWLNQNLPSGATILVEGGNVVDLPLRNQKNFQLVIFDFYSLDEKPALMAELKEAVASADYFLSPSRRIFANHWQSEQFPQTANFYQELFAGKLGFVFLQEFKVFQRWEEILLGSDLNSEETWTVFDHPVIRLFGKQ